MPLIPIKEIFVNNTSTEVFINSKGEKTQYFIKPIDGYVLHLKELDGPVFDENTGDITGYKERYSLCGTSVSVNYDFTAKTLCTYTYTDNDGNKKTISIEKSGSNNLYALPEALSKNKTLSCVTGGDTNE